MENNSDKQAFPRPGYEQTNLADHSHYEHVDGLTKREYFAIQMLPTIAGIHSEDTMEDHCETAIRYADELLKQLAITPSPLTPS